MIVVVFSYYSLISRIFWEINKVYRHIESSISEASEFTQLLIDPPLVQDAPEARQLQITDANIRFNKVDFKYNDGDQDEKNLFLNKFNLDIKSKQKVGLVGSSGGGKTTIVKLLLRFIDLQSGKITIDGQDISKISQISLRDAIAYVPQEPLLFHRSLFENISYGNENASEADVVKAAKLAHADEFITKLPHGYETLVGERGIKLSGDRGRESLLPAHCLKNPQYCFWTRRQALLTPSRKNTSRRACWN